VDIQQAAAGEYLLELVFLQLVHTGAAADDHGLDVEIVEGIGQAVEQYPVLGGDLLALVGIATVVPTATMVAAGLVAGLVQAVAIVVVGKIMPGVLFVRNFGTALGASLTMTVVGWLVMLVF